MLSVHQFETAPLMYPLGVLSHFGLDLPLRGRASSGITSMRGAAAGPRRGEAPLVRTTI